jgi:hypothetical protein
MSTPQRVSPAKFLLVILFAYVLLKPFYFGSSGGAQIADAVLCLAVLAALFGAHVKWPAPQRAVLGAALLFTGYMAMVNLFWFAVLAEKLVAYSAAFAIFNVLLYVIFAKAALMDFERAFRTLAWAVAISAYLQVLLSGAAMTTGAVRQTLFFNNPNQLGYWALLSASMFVVCLTRVRLPLYVQVSTLLCLAYLSALSLSKAAMLSLALLLGLHFLRNPKLMIAGAIVVGAITVLMPDPEIVDHVVNRIDDIGSQSDDNAAGRGYTRITDYPQYLLFGAGEGGFSRFVGVTFELHSTFGTILFSYGVIGCLFFLLFMNKLLRCSGWHQFMYILPSFLYGITHQGLRFSFLWLLLAVIAASRAHVAAKTRPPPARPTLSVISPKVTTR